MVEAKHEFIDDNPYIVYTSQDTIVYSDKADTSIDDVSGGDLALAHVDIKNNSTHAAYFECPAVSSLDELTTELVIQTTEEINAGIIIYKDSGYANLKIDDDHDYSKVNIATTGDIVWNDDSEAFEISGDGTITFTDKA